jgi:hypothetical protein
MIRFSLARCAVDLVDLLRLLIDAELDLLVVLLEFLCLLLGLSGNVREQVLTV